MKSIFVLAPAIVVLGIPYIAEAHHPGAAIDEFMGSKEKYFEIVDQPTAPSFELVDAGGNVVKLSDFSEKIVVLNFAYASCPDVCPLHAEMISSVQAMINGSPMKDAIQFLTVTTDPINDTSGVLREYGPDHGIDPVNWRFLTSGTEQPDDMTRSLADAYGLKFSSTDDGLQMHAVVTHIIDRNGRFAAKFHGLRFEPVNLVLYLNGLMNNWRTPNEPAAASWWEQLKGLFE